MLRKNIVLEADNDDYSLYDINKNIAIDKNLMDLQTNKNLNIIITGKELFIKEIIIPFKKNINISSLIENQLKYYIQDRSNVIYTYVKFKYKNQIKIIMYCINWLNFDLVKKMVEKGNNINTINPIQYSIFKYYKSNITHENYILIFYYNSYIYFLHCEDYILVSNYVKKSHVSHNVNLIEYINNYLNNKNIEPNTKIYLVNFKAHKEEYCKLNYEYIDLGEITPLMLYKYCVWR